MRTLCQFPDCRALIRDGATGPNGEVSHGICGACVPRVEAQLREFKARRRLERATLPERIAS